MKAKGLYIILSLYSFTRWFTDYFEDNYSHLFDANILYFMFDGGIICCIGLFLYLSSDKDYAAKCSLSLIVLLGILQAYSYFNKYIYNEYTYYLPAIVAGVTLLEIYKHRTEMLKSITWAKGKLKNILKR